MKNLGKIVGINVHFEELEKETGERKPPFEYTYGADAEDMGNHEIHFINGPFVYVWNVTHSAYDIYPEHRIHSIGVIHENDNQEKPGRKIVSFGVPEGAGGPPNSLIEMEPEAEGEPEAESEAEAELEDDELLQ